VPDLTARSGRVHREVTDTSGSPLRPGEDLTAHHDAAADSGPQGDQGEGILPPTHPEPGLGVGEGAHVVGHGAGQPGGLGDHGGQRDIAPPQEGGHHHGPPSDDGRSQGDPDDVRPASAAPCQALHHRGDEGGDGLGVGLGQRQGVSDQHLTQRVGQDGVEAVGSELDTCHGGTVRDDGQEASGPPRSTHLRRRLLLDETGLDEGTHRARRRRRRQPQALPEVTAAHRAGRDQGEQRPGSEAASSTIHVLLPLPPSPTARWTIGSMTWDDAHRRPIRTDTVGQTLAETGAINYFHLTRNRSWFLPPPPEGR